MVRKQIYIKDEQDRELQLMIATGEESYSELIRKGVDFVIKDKKKKKPKKFGEGFIGAVKGGPKTDAVQMIHDYYRNDVV